MAELLADFSFDFIDFTVSDFYKNLRCLCASVDLIGRIRPCLKRLAYPLYEFRLRPDWAYILKSGGCLSTDLG